MVKKNIHCFYSPILNESRLFKELNYLEENNIVTNTFIIGYWQHGLLENEICSDKRKIKRLRSLAKEFAFKIKIFKKLFLLFAILEIFIKYLYQIFKYQPNFITCHNLFLLPICVIGKLFTGSKLIYSPHELETEKAGLTGWLKKISILCEKYFIKFSNSTVVVCQPIAEWYKKKYNINNIFVIRNIPQLKYNSSEKTENIFRSKFKIPEDHLIFLYQGNLDTLRGCVELLECFKSVKPNLHIVFMGYGDLQEMIIADSKVYKNIHFHPAVPTDLILSHTSCADVGINVIPFEISLSYRLSLPNKYFEYLFSCIPVVVSNNLEYLSKEVNENNLGWVYDYNSISFSSFINSLDVKKMNINDIKRYTKYLNWNYDAEILKKVYY
jgi:hypothetical protein